MSEPAQVFIVTSGEYSSYGIDSVWLTLEEARAAAGEYENVEVWPVGGRKRTLGSFHRSVTVDCATGDVQDYNTYDSPDYEDGQHVMVRTYGAGRLLVSVHSGSEERTNKVLSEVLARVSGDLALGLDPWEIAGEPKPAPPVTPTGRVVPSIGSPEYRSAVAAAESVEEVLRLAEGRGGPAAVRPTPWPTNSDATP